MSKIKLLIIIGAVFTFLYSCNGGTQHTHEFENGKCECGEMDPNYVVHIHEYIEGRCECGNVDVSHLSFENATYLYDGSKHEVLVEGELPEGVTIQYVNNSLTNAGSISAQANVIYKNDVIKTLNATLTVNKRNVTLKALDVEALRGSNPVNHGYSVIEGEILNSDLSKINPTILIDSEINQNSEVGLYENVISISFIPNANYNINIINGNYKIYTNTFNIDELNISDKDVTYDGEKHLINISNLPSFIDVEYYYNNELTDGLVDAGVYEIKMIFTSNSVEYTLNKIEITKTLTIEKKKVEGSILPTSVNYLEDLILAHFDIKWDNLILDKDYDLFNFVYKIDESLGNFPNVGEYSNVIDLTYKKNDNYEITIKKGSLLVNKIEFNKETIKFNDQTFSYDGLEHTLLMENELPSDFTITYTNNIQKDPGIYNVSLTISSPNYYEIDTFNATLEILKDGKYHDVTFKQGDESFVNIVVQNNTLITNIPEIIGIDGYSCLWDFDFNTLVQSDLLIGLSFTPITYTITYMLDGVENNPLNPLTFTIEDEITLLEPQKRGYTFIGWYLEEEFINEIETIELGSIEDIYLYAKFEENIYNLNYYVGNELIDTEEVIFNSNYSIKEVTPYGDEYEIFKWIYNDELWNTSSIITYNYDYDIDLYGEIAYIGSDYYYTLDENTASIDGYSGIIENLVIPKFIKNNNQYYSVKTIGEDAFYGCSSLTSIVIPNSVTSIGSYAFENCSSLKNVYYSGTIDDWCNIDFDTYDSNPMYYAEHFYMKDTNNEWYEVTKIVIPDTVTSIDYQFISFDNITKIVIPSSVTSIGFGAFAYCSTLASIIVDENNSVYDSRNNCNAIIETDTNILIVGCENTVIPNSVTSIGFGAFAYCSSLASITIPNSVTSIGSEAFYNCSSLSSITIPNSVTRIGSSAFAYCSTLASITIPNSVTSIGSFAFEDCSSLASITIPNSVTSIGSDAFRNCSSLASITMPNSVTSIASSTFAYCSSLASITIPNSVTSIGYYAFLGCSSLENITIPKSVPNIGERAFYGCNNLENVYYYGTIEDWCGSIFRDVSDNPMSYAEHFYMLNDEGEWEEVIDISIPDSVTTISQYIFHGFDNIISITIPNSVISIGSNAFSNCISLESIVIPDSVTSIGSEILYSCYSLKFITLPFLGKEIDEQYSYFGYIFGATSCFNQYRNIPNSLREVIITGGTFIADTAFYNCSSLESITIPNSVTIIGVQAFSYCSSLASITIPNSVTGIGIGAFYGCSGLESIEIPNSVRGIGDYAFYECRNLESIIVDDGNSYYKSINGNLYTEDGKVLIQYATGKSETEFIIPNSVTSIGSYAFYNCSSLASIIIPNSVTSIGEEAFGNCSSLTIYCEATSKPSGWYSSWNCDNRPVVWGYTNE